MAKPVTEHCDGDVQTSYPLGKLRVSHECAQQERASEDGVNSLAFRDNRCMVQDFVDGAFSPGAGLRETECGRCCSESGVL